MAQDSEPMAAGLSHHAFSVILYNGTIAMSELYEECIFSGDPETEAGH